MLCALLLFVGCSSKPVATIDAEINSGSNPVVEADVQLEHKTDDNAKFFGITLENGEVQIDAGEGIPPGFYTITVTTYELQNGSPATGEEGEAAKVDGLAVKKEFIFKRQLEAGSNDLSLDIQKTDG